MNEIDTHRMGDRPTIIVLHAECKGPNSKCKRDARNGRTVHMTTWHDENHETLVLPSYHFETAEIGDEYIRNAWNTAITVKTDNDLYDARRAQTPYRLPIGWIDPDRRGNRVMTLRFER